MYFGDLLKELRCKQNITQKELAHHIVGLRHIKKLENNQCTPNPETIILFSNRLGINIYDYMEYTIYKKPLEAYNFFYKLKELHKLRLHDDISKIVNSNQARSYTLYSHRKIISWYNLSTEAYISKKYDEGVNKLIQLIADCKHCKNDLASILDATIDTDDYPILNSIANLLIETGRVDEGIELYKSLVSKLLLISSSNPPIFILPIIFNLTKSIYSVDKIDDCIYYIKIGLKIAKDHGSLIYIGDLCANLANCYEKLGNKELCIKHSAYFLFAFELSNDKKYAPAIRKDLENQFGKIFH